jgi:hypothetical protein
LPCEASVPDGGTTACDGMLPDGHHIVSPMINQLSLMLLLLLNF